MSGTVHQVRAYGVGAVKAMAHEQVIRLMLISERDVVLGIANLTVDEARGLSVRLAEAIAKATIPQFAHLPHRCPSNHWNDGNDVCADCGESLQ